MKNKAILSVILLSFSLLLNAQKVNISGYISDAKTGEKLIGANVYIKNTSTGTVSNEYGYYSIRLSKNINTTLIISYLGYKTMVKNLMVKENKHLNFELQPEEDNLKEVVLNIKKEKPIQDRLETGKLNIPVKQIKMMPQFGGETDIIKAYQLMPGVSSGKEGSSDLYVRGGSPDQNLMLLDGVPLYYVSHLGGFVSIFNSDAIQNINLFKGGFPARFGNRLSSVVDIRMKDGNKKKIHGNFSVGLLGAKLSLNGPINSKSSYFVSFRRLFIDLFSRPISYFSDDMDSSFGYYFYDFNAKYNYKINSNNHIYFSLYGGDDKSVASFYKGERVGELFHKAEATFKNYWGNKLAALRWNHIFNERLFSNNTLSYTNYHYVVKQENDFSDEDFSSSEKFTSKIQDITLKNDFEYHLSNTYQIQFGMNNTFHTYSPFVNKYEQKDGKEVTKDTVWGANKEHSFDLSFFIENKLHFGNKFSANLGLRNQNLFINGRTFNSFEPRLLLNFKLTKNSSIKASYTFMQQNTHLLIVPKEGMPMNLWLPATNLAPPEISKQYTLGYTQSIDRHNLELSVEGYYKKGINFIHQIPGKRFGESTDNWENNVLKNGKGLSYGLEVLLQKKTGRFTGWIGYTWANTTRQFDGLNKDEAFPFKYDRRHDLSIVFNYKLKKNIDFSATWQYGSAYPTSFALAKYHAISQPGDQWYPEYNIYGKVNSIRLRSFHRLDVGFNFRKQKKHGIRTWNISVMNMYNRMNPYFYYVDIEDKNGKEEINLKSITIFPFLPSFSYSYSF